MNIIKPKYEILDPQVDDPDIEEYIYKMIERAGRTCYKSEDKITKDSAERFVKTIVKQDHLAMLEHAHMTVKFTVDRAVSHEIVRHRLASFAQESQRYCCYNQDKFDGNVTFIRPWFLKYANETATTCWMNAIKTAEQSYLALLSIGCKPEEARMVLPNSTKTELIVTANMREWRHIFKLRAIGTTGAPNPAIAEVMYPLMQQCAIVFPAIFGDLVKEDNDGKA